MSDTCESSSGCNCCGCIGCLTVIAAIVVVGMLLYGYKFKVDVKPPVKVVPNEQVIDFSDKDL